MFELFVRSLAPRRGFLLAAGLQQAIDFLENLRFDFEIDSLKSSGRFEASRLSRQFSLYRRGARHRRRHRILYQRADPARDRAAAASLTRRIASHQYLALSIRGRPQAAQCVLTTPGKLLVDFGMRRARRRVSTACDACASP